MDGWQTRIKGNPPLSTVGETLLIVAFSIRGSAEAQRPQVTCPRSHSVLAEALCEKVGWAQPWQLLLPVSSEVSENPKPVCRVAGVSRLAS